MRSLLTLILFSITLASPAYALTIQASPQPEAIIEQQWERLSPCIQGHIERHLHHVKVVKHGILGTKIVGGEKFYNHAISYLAYGWMFIDQKNVDPVVIMHEFGHWFDEDVIWPNYEHAWEDALRLDFIAMGAEDMYEDEYLHDPDEAAAQLFAYATMDSKTYERKPYYEADAFPHANALMTEILTKTCPGGS